MNAPDIESLLSEWRRLTEAEHDAIADDNWTQVHRQQRCKDELKARISSAVAALKEDVLNFARFRPLVRELMTLETDNARLVALRREVAEGALAESGRAVGHLRGLSRAYGAAADANWSSYS